MNVDNAEIVSQLRARLPKEAFTNISDYQILVMYLMLRKDINETIKNDTLQAMRTAMVFISNLHENKNFRVEVSLENGFTVTSLPETKPIPKTKKLTDYEYIEKCIEIASVENVTLKEVCKTTAKTGREIDLTNSDYYQLSRGASFSYSEIVEAFEPIQIKWPERK